MLKSKKRGVLIGAALAVVVAVGAVAYFNRPTAETDDQNTVVQSHPTYKLQLDSGQSYSNLDSIDLSFKITDEKDQILKAFDEVHGGLVHFTAVRKDRGEIVYLDPTYDEPTGTFTVNGADFPSDGDYRLLADFTPNGSQMGPDGTKLSVTTYQDITVGDTSNYKPTGIGFERFKSSDNGFDINVFLAPHDPSDPGLAAGSTSSFAASVNKDGSPYRQLEDYEESRGSITLLGPDLEYVHAHSTNDEVPDTYVLAFSVLFPSSGAYKGFLQSQTEGRINNTDYVLTVAEEPTSIQPEAPPAGHGGM